METRLRILGGMLLVLASLGGSAHAEDKAAAREHYAKASKLHALGHFDEAVKEFEAAYQAYEDPSFLYNIGQDHRLAGHSERALFFYKSYLTHKPNAPNAAEVQQRIVELQKIVDEELAKKQADEAEAKRVEAARAQAQEEEARRNREAEEAARLAAIAAAPPRATIDLGAARKKRIAGIALGAAGLGVAIAGITMGALAAKATNQLHADSVNGAMFDPNLQARGRAFNIAGPICDVIGGAAVVTGIVLYVIGHRDQERARREGQVSVAGRSLAVRF